MKEILGGKYQKEALLTKQSKKKEPREREFLFEQEAVLEKKFMYCDADVQDIRLVMPAALTQIVAKGAS